MAFNRLLERQIRRHFGDTSKIPNELLVLFEHISRSYDHHEEDRKLIERTLDLSSRELLDAFEKLRSEANKLEQSRLELLISKEKAEEMSRLKSAFLANMSHEIRTPMTAIIGFADYLIEEHSCPPEAEQCIAIIKSSADRLLGTINGILDLSRIESDTVEVDMKPVDVLPELVRVLEMLRPLAIKKGLSLILEESENLIAFTDSTLLYQILANIIGNAIKFTEEGYVSVRLSMRVEAQTPRVMIQIKDTGIGISSSFLPHVFEEFNQESDGFSRSHEGTGLGLTISKALAESIGATITVQSVKGSGSEFALLLPLGETPAESQDEQQAQIESHAAPPRGNVLVVEDTAETRELLKLLLKAKFNLTFASDSSSATAVCNNTSFDLIVMDINLGNGASGLDVVREMREGGGPNVSTPVLALTAYAMKGNRETILESGCDDYLAKPFTKSLLLEAMGRLLASMKSVLTIRVDPKIA